VQLVPSVRRIAAPLALVVALFALAAGSAHASLLVADGANCGQYSSSQVFLPWGDPASYTLAPGGDFESKRHAWDVQGEARVVKENEPAQVGGESDSSSLLLSRGTTVTSPAMCVGLGEPDLRVFFKRTSWTAVSPNLRVDVLFVDANGDTQTLNVGNLDGGRSWSLSPQLLIVANLLPLLDQGTPVSFRLSAAGDSFQVDDLYVDPWHRP
jgi:hypothetical protein